MLKKKVKKISGVPFTSFVTDYFRPVNGSASFEIVVFSPSWSIFSLSTGSVLSDGPSMCPSSDLSFIDLSTLDKSAFSSLCSDFGLSSVNTSLISSFIIAGLSSFTFDRGLSLVLVSCLSESGLSLVSVAVSSLSL